MYLDLVVGCLSEVKRSLVLNSFNCYCFDKNIRYYNIIMDHCACFDVIGE